MGANSYAFATNTKTNIFKKEKIQTRENPDQSTQETVAEQLRVLCPVCFVSFSKMHIILYSF